MRISSAVSAFFLLIGLTGAHLSYGQPNGADSETNPRLNPYGTGLGLEVLITNSGFGFGSYYNRELNSGLSFMAELSLGSGKDERELKFFRFGTSYIPNKANYFLMLPIQAGIIQRLFQEKIEDNFRPFFQMAAGPTLGWEYPYFRDSNRNGRYDADVGERTYDAISSLFKGEFRMGIGGSLAIGAHFGLSRKVTQGVRIGYMFTHFFEGIQLLEPSVQEAQHFFGTPTISLLFGKIF